VTVPRNDPKPLEPWALELLRHDRLGDDQHTQLELARLVALLRALPDPERSPDLAQQILAHVAEQSARSRVTHGVFGIVHQLSRPAVAGMLAAGIAAAVIVFTVAPESIPSSLRVDETVASTVAPMVSESGAPIRPHRHQLVRPQFVSAVFAQAPAAVRFAPERAQLDDAFDARLDRQLNQLMIDPTAFAQRLEHVAQRDQFIARLAKRAAERGDAPEIALRVRESPHPLAGLLVDRLLRATLVAAAAPR
jgi:hypothetical protein